MKKERVNKAEIKLIGLSACTNNRNEMNPSTAKIGELVSRFWNENIAERLRERINPGVTFSVYTDYVSDEHDDYTYFIGEEVDSIEYIPAGLQKLIIPAAEYQKFTTPAGKMPDVVVHAWQQIWKMSPAEIGGQRAYRADFELYDQRASDLTNAIVDIYIGVK